jgi:hypothetical protein
MRLIEQTWKPCFPMNCTVSKFVLCIFAYDIGPEFNLFAKKSELTQFEHKNFKDNKSTHFTLHVIKYFFIVDTTYQKCFKQKLQIKVGLFILLIFV